MQFSHRTAGFALFEALVALLLFAVALLTACSTLALSLRRTHEAQLATRAVDLASDLVEALHAQPAVADTDALFSAARERVDTALPESARQTALDLIDLAATLRQEAS